MQYVASPFYSTELENHKSPAIRCKTKCEFATGLTAYVQTLCIVHETCIQCSDVIPVRELNTGQIVFKDLL